MRTDLLANITQSSSSLELAAARVLREALDNIDVHPCDEGDDIVAARSLPEEMQQLLKALTGHDPFPATQAATGAPRPDVKIVRVMDETQDMTHCNIVADGIVVYAPFEQDIEAVQAAVQARFPGLELNVAEIAALNSASRDQMILEFGRVVEQLKEVEHGNVARIRNNFWVWLDSDGAPRWSCIEQFGVMNPEQVTCYAVEDIQGLDCDEFYGIAQGLREWLISPYFYEVAVFRLLRIDLWSYGTGRDDPLVALRNRSVV